MNYPSESVDAFEFRMRDQVTDEWFYQTAPSWEEFERILISVSHHRGHPMELWAISRYDSDPTEPEKPWMDEGGKPLFPWKRIAVLDRAARKWRPSFNGPSMGSAEKKKREPLKDPYDLTDVPPATLVRAERLLREVSRDMLLCGDTAVVAGWWIESHSLGCRREADEPEEDWWSSHWEILEEHERDGISRILMDADSGAFVTMHPQKGTTAGPSMGAVEGASWSVIVTTPPPSETFVVAKEATIEEARRAAEEWGGGIEWTSERRGVAHFGEAVSIEPSQLQPDERPLRGIRWDELVETGAFERYLGPALGLPLNKFGEVLEHRRGELRAVSEKFGAWLIGTLGRMGVEAYSDAGSLIYPSQVRTLATELEGGSELWMSGTARAFWAMLRDLAPESAELSMGAAKRRVKPLRFTLDQAKNVAAIVEREWIKPNAEWYMLVGSIRRNRPDPGDVEFVVLPTDLERFLEVLTDAGFHGGERKRTAMVGEFPVEIYIAHSAKELGAMVMWFTGDWKFNVAMNSIAKRKGYTRNQYGIWKGSKPVLQSKSERDFFKFLGVRYHEPEERSFAHRKKATAKKSRRARMGNDDNWDGFWKEDGEEE